MGHMRIALFGKDGQLGSRLQGHLAVLGEVFAFGKTEADFSNPSSLPPLLQYYKPDIVINAAAFTKVDESESKPDLALVINAAAPGILAEEARKLGALMVQFSTDYVFDGQKNHPYNEEDKPNPINAYGMSKLAGEDAIQSAGVTHLILRTSWVYEIGFQNFLTRVLSWLRSLETVYIADDQLGSPTWATVLARKTVELLSLAGSQPLRYFARRGGTYHLAGNGIASRFDWADLIRKYDPHKMDQTAQLNRVKAEYFSTAAKRPANSALDCSKIRSTFGLEWKEWNYYIKEALSNS